jgi:hypothetical protein
VDGGESVMASSKSEDNAVLIHRHGVVNLSFPTHNLRAGI